MAGKIEVVQANTVGGLGQAVTKLVGFGYSLFGNPFALGGMACQIVVQGDDQPVEDLEYQVVETNWTSTFEKQLEALLADGWTMYGSPFALGMTVAQVVKKGDIPVVSDGGGSGGATAWADITGKPATFPPVVGTTATTAKAGNYAPTATEVGNALKAKTQIAALAAVATPDATDEATAITLVNALKVSVNAQIAALKA